MGNSKNADNITAATGSSQPYVIGRSKAAQPSPKFEEIEERAEASEEEQEEAVAKRKTAPSKKDKKSNVEDTYPEADGSN